MEGSEQHHTTGLKVESPSEKEVRVDQGLKEHLEKISGRRDIQSGTLLIDIWQAGTEESQMQRNCQWHVKKLSKACI